MGDTPRDPAPHETSGLDRYADRLQVARSFARRLAQAVSARRWFPHAPLAIGLGLLGWGAVGTTSDRTLRVFRSGHLVHALAHGSIAVLLLPLGAAMLAMSLGLVLRSRFAWVVSLVLSAATLAVTLIAHRGAVTAAAVYDVVMLIGLLAAYRAFGRSSAAAGALVALTSGGMLLAYGVFGAFYLGEDFNPPIRDLASALYYAMVTMSTVGYGDITPRTTDARLFTVSLIVLGITVFATSLSAIVGPLIGGNLRRILNQTERRMKRKNHYIIAGQSPLARNTYRELHKRNQPVTVILVKPPASHEFDEADLIIGDPTNVDVLRQAGALDAQAVLAMRDDDSENAFIVLAVKDLDCKAKTVAAVNDSNNVARVRRVRPDIILAPQVLGGELLAMALSGESIHGDYLVDRFLHFEG